MACRGYFRFPPAGRAGAPMRWEDAVTWVGEDGGSADAGGTMAVADLLHALAGGKPEESAGAADAASEADGEEMRRSLVRDLSLALMFLTSWEEKGPGGPVRRCWKGFDWDAVDSLHEDGLIDCSNKAKSLYLTDEGAGLGAFIAGICAEAVATAREEIARELLAGMPVSNERAFRLRVELDLDGLHDCWRELVVPARFTFAELHEAIQAAFLWWNYHLYDFELTSRGEKLRISDPDQGGVDAMFGMMFGGSIPKTQVDAHDIRLDDVFPRTRIARYSYDYGDGWEHRVKLVETIACYEGEMPACTDGAGDAPPEDVGGPGGFGDFLRIAGDADDPERGHMVAWGESQFYEPFSLEAANRRIHAWRTGELFDEWDERHSGEDAGLSW